MMNSRQQWQNVGKRLAQPMIYGKWTDNHYGDDDDNNNDDETNN